MDLRAVGPAVDIGAACEKLPSTVAYFAGELINKPVDYSEPVTIVTVWKPSVASTEITEDTQISGGLWATATGLEFRDGTNVSPIPCDYDADDTLVFVLDVATDGTMVLKKRES